MAKPKQPRTRRQWQTAVDGAAAARAIADCKLYGLIEGGPAIDVDRCDQILAGGRRRGIEPSKPVNELAVELLFAINEEAGSRTKGVEMSIRACLWCDGPAETRAYGDDILTHCMNEECKYFDLWMDSGGQAIVADSFPHPVNLEVTGRDVPTGELNADRVNRRGRI